MIEARFIGGPVDGRRQTVMDKRPITVPVQAPTRWVSVEPPPYEIGYAEHTYVYFGTLDNGIAIFQYVEPTRTVRIEVEVRDAEGRDLYEVFGKLEHSYRSFIEGGPEGVRINAVSFRGFSVTIETQDWIKGRHGNVVGPAVEKLQTWLASKGLQICGTMQVSVDE